jgi:hypothetical protein
VGIPVKGKAREVAMKVHLAVSCGSFPFLFLLMGCTPGTLPVRADLPSREFRRVSSMELASRGATDLYEALEQCRPRFLFPSRGGSHPPVAYLDGVRLVDLDALRALHPREIIEVKLLSSAEATTLFGTGHMGGALVIRAR